MQISDGSCGSGARAPTSGESVVIAASTQPHTVFVIGSPHPEKSPPPVDNLPAKSVPAPPGRDGLLPVNCRSGETFLWGGTYNGETFHEAGDVLIRGRHQIRDYLYPGGFS